MFITSPANCTPMTEDQYSMGHWDMAFHVPIVTAVGTPGSPELAPFLEQLGQYFHRFTQPRQFLRAELFQLVGKIRNPQLAPFL